MNNVKTFFKVLKKMEQLESKRMGNVIRNTRIFIFKSNIGYSIPKFDSYTFLKM